MSCSSFVHKGRRYGVCFDCIVESLKTSNIIPSRECNLKGDVKKICEICLEEVINMNSKSCICCDCVADALINHNILKKKETQHKVVVKKVHPRDNMFRVPNDEFHDIIPSHNKSKQPCDICGAKVIHANRRNRICYDCVLNSLIVKGIIEIQEIPTLEIPGVKNVN